MNYTEEAQEPVELEQRLKAAVWYTVGKICNQEGKADHEICQIFARFTRLPRRKPVFHFTLPSQPEELLNVKASPEFIASLAEV
ncbi:hypothetical protein BC937DRAFT_86381, partial [Endogone sp. FLAS-F59071]